MPALDSVSGAGGQPLALLLPLLQLLQLVHAGEITLAGCRAWKLFQARQRVLQRALEFAGGAFDGLTQAGRLVVDRERTNAAHTRLQHTPLFLVTVLGTVGVTQ